MVDLLAERARGTLRRHKRARAAVLEGHIGALRAVLVQPLTYMNDSGDAVAPLLDFYRVPVERLVVVHDEIDLPFGHLRLKVGGGDNGHNGLRSVRRSLGTGQFHRVRIGVGRPPGRLDPAVFVLRTFTPTEQRELPLVRERAADALSTLLAEGLATAQNTFND